MRCEKERVGSDAVALGIGLSLLERRERQPRKRTDRSERKKEIVPRETVPDRSWDLADGGVDVKKVLDMGPDGARANGLLSSSRDHVRAPRMATMPVSLAECAACAIKKGFRRALVELRCDVVEWCLLAARTAR
jgi:hypothetical protein